jgi:hypothetical protein
VYQIVFDISETMTNLDIVSLRSDVTLSKPQISQSYVEQERKKVRFNTRHCMRLSFYCLHVYNGLEIRPGTK